MKKLILFLFIVTLFFNVQNVQASHYMGGEITWECIPAGQPNAGKFIFTLKLYRECNGVQFGTTQTINTTHPSVSSFTVTEITGWPKDISPNCNSSSVFSHITCAGASTNNTGAVQEHIYRSNPIQLSGVPPAIGWTFAYSSCCRNPCTNIANATSLGWTLRAKMYAYQNINTYPCFDNSPTFAEVPRTVICTGYPFTYNHNAFDKELDSLSFEWGQPLGSNSAPINTYNFGYSYNNPLPGPTQNPLNVGAVVNPTTGTISFTSYTSGAYVTSTKVSAYRCGVKIAEIWRDMQVVLLSCGINTPPDVIPPFNAGTSFVDTVYAGEYVSFALNAQDFEFLPNGVPQTMKIEVSGPQFGSFVAPTPTTQPTFSSTNGCLSATNTPPGPCAVLTPAPGPGYPLQGVFGIQTQFGWQTTCSHLATNTGCGVTSNVYNFVMKVSDDFCPAPAIDISTMTVVVLAKPTIPSPPIQCVEVLPSGDVKLSWSVPIDTMSTFDSYRISYSNSFNGPYTAIDSIFDIGINTYTHVGANANTTPGFYILGVRAGCPGHLLFSAADTFATINLSAINNMNGSAVLNWDPSYNPLLSSSTGIYNVERDYPSTTLVQIDSTSNIFYVDPITACGDDISYAVSILDTNLLDSNGVAHTCVSRSNVSTDYFADITPPFTPVIDSVSVNPITGNAIISWDKNAAGDTRAYVIYLLVNGATTPIDTVWGDSITTYVDMNNYPCSTNGDFNTYSVAAFDSCGHISALSEMQNTINLTAKKDICDDKITLTWNSYNNMTGGLNHYEVFYSENGSMPSLLTTSLPGDTVFEHLGLNNGSTYCYVIRAIGDSAVSSTSCSVCEVANKPNQPQFVYIRSASVIEGNDLGVKLRIFTDTTAKVTLYRIERTDDGVNWNAIATLPPDYTNPNRSYIDAMALTTVKSYRYRTVVVDSCGVDALTSNIAKTMLLTVKANDSLFNELRWNAYSGYIGTPNTYEIFRAVDGVWEITPVITLPATQLIYKDDVTSYKDQGGLFAYKIAALEGSGNPLFSDTSMSNSASALQKPRLYVPSAFDPNSSQAINRTFYPHGVFVNSQDYLFIVFNRWGEKVFETTTINKGWDGTYNGIKVEGDVYTYYVRFTSSSGYLFENRGTVTLIR